MSGRLIVVGGGLGGVAAALAAARRGVPSLLLEETALLGGQLTSQAVPPDEHPWIEGFGCTQSYRELRDTIRSIYRSKYPLNSRALRARALNIGNATVSPIAHEPSIARLAIETLLAPFVSMGLIEVRLRCRVTQVESADDRIVGLEVVDGATGRRWELDAASSIVIDATETGDLLELGDVEHVTGTESVDDTGEPSAPSVADPTNMQACTWVFAVDHRAGEDHTIDRPKNYDYWRTLRPKFWPGRLLGFAYPDPRTLATVEATFEPNADSYEDLITADQSKVPSGSNLWHYRRILWRYHFARPLHSDVTLVNWPMNDYFEGPLFGDENAAEHAEGAKELSKSLLYWLQTEAPCLDGGTGWPGLRLRPDVVMTDDGFAATPYVRESRRALTQTRIVEQDLSYAVRGKHGAVNYPDSVGIGAYRIDLHPTTGGDTFLDVASTPFQIPLGALVPVRVTNLIPGAKNIGTTHITNGCYRLHPVEWNIGEAAAVLAIHTLRARTSVQQAHASEAIRLDVQDDLVRGGVELAWPDLGGY